MPLNDDTSPVVPTTVPIGPGEIPLTVVIRLDEFPQETGWRIDRLGIEVETIERVPAGIYIVPNQIVVRTIILEEGETYFFNRVDVLGNGIQNGVGT